MQTSRTRNTRSPQIQECARGPRRHPDAQSARRQAGSGHGPGLASWCSQATLPHLSADYAINPSLSRTPPSPFKTLLCAPRCSRTTLCSFLCAAHRSSRATPAGAPPGERRHDLGTWGPTAPAVCPPLPRKGQRGRRTQWGPPSTVRTPENRTEQSETRTTWGPPVAEPSPRHAVAAGERSCLLLEARALPSHNSAL